MAGLSMGERWMIAMAALLGAGVATPAAAAVSPHVLTDATERVSVGAHVEVLADPGGRMSLEDAQAAWRAGRYEALAGVEPSLGFSDDVHWFHFAVRSARARAETWWLEVAYPLLDDVRVFAVGADGSVERHVAGDRFPFDHRAIDYRNFVFPVHIDPARTQHVYVRVDTDSAVQFSMVLWTQRAFAVASARGQLWLGMFYGLILVMIVYNLFLFGATRAPSYLLFCLFAAAYLAVQGGLDGVTYQLVWPHSPGLNSVAMPMSIALTEAAAIAFARRFLDLREVLPRWHRTLGVQMVATLVLAAASVWLPYALAVRIVMASAALLVPLLLIAGLGALRGGFAAARFFVAGWSVFLVTSLLLVLSKFGVIPPTVFTAHGPQIGFVANVILLSFALADRVRLLELEKDAAQRGALQIQLRAKKTLEAEVAHQTRELREQARRLEQADELKTRFFQNVSHELRTPLTLMLAPLEQLQYGQRPGAAHQFTFNLHSRSCGGPASSRRRTGELRQHAAYADVLWALLSSSEFASNH